MAQTNAAVSRPDEDIFDDLENLYTSARYAPLMHDRHHLHFEIHEGVVHVSGHVKVQTTRRYLLAQIPRIAGVKSVVADQLYDDETLRLEVGRVTPEVQVMVEYGTIILAGSLPPGSSAEQIAAAANRVAGVKKVVTTF